jgi:phage shock protein PspC (stress-responsive transcriptional regulator)
MTENPTLPGEPVDPDGSPSSSGATAPGSTSSDAPGAGTAGPGTYGPGSYGPGYPPPYPPPAYAPPRRPLRRSRNDRVISGVCGGLAENLAIDATLLRILVVVATVFTGGALILAYLLAWLLMPDTPAYVVPVGAPQAAPQYATAGAPADAPASYAAGGTGTYIDPATGQVYGPPVAVAPQPRTEPRSYLGWITLSAAVAAGGLLGILGAAGVSISGLVVASVILLVLGGGLLVGAWRGRARWLIAPALVMLLFVQGAAAVDDIRAPGSGAGDRTWTPTGTSQSYSLGAGSATLDLRKLPAGDADVDVSIGAGELIVLLPADASVRIDGSIGAGEFDLPGKEPQSGVGLNMDATVFGTPTPADGPDPVTTTNVDLTAQIGLGTLEVRRATS